MRLFRGMGGYLSEFFEKAQPFGIRGDLLLDFLERVGNVFLA